MTKEEFITELRRQVALGNVKLVARAHPNGSEPIIVPAVTVLQTTDRPDQISLLSTFAH